MTPPNSIEEVSGPLVRCTQCPIRAKALFQVVSEDYITHA